MPSWKRFFGRSLYNARYNKLYLPRRLILYVAAIFVILILFLDTEKNIRYNFDGNLNISNFVFIKSILQKERKIIWKKEGAEFDRDFYYFSKPRYTLGNITQSVEILMGIPTVKRKNSTYLLQTIDSLLANHGAKTSFGILILIGEDDYKFTKRTMEQIWNRFESEILRGLLMVISSPKFYYPKNWKKVSILRFGDSLARIKWRSKQNIDVIYLMVRAHKLSPRYFLLLQDDIFPSKDYLNKISFHANFRSTTANPWIYLSFSNLIATGILFRVDSLPSIYQFLSIFWNKKSLDGLMIDFLRVKYCTVDMLYGQCERIYRSKYVFVYPALFRHAELFSSLPRKRKPSFQSSRGLQR